MMLRSSLLIFICALLCILPTSFCRPDYRSNTVVLPKPQPSRFDARDGGRQRSSVFPEKSRADDGVRYEMRTVTDFATRDSRLGFIRKVYAIFSVQMLCTITITATIMNNPEIQRLLLTNFKPFAAISYLLSTAVIVALCSKPSLRYKSPINFILLGIHSVLQSITVGVISSLLDPRTVCLGTVHTLAAFLSITLYSLQPSTKFDLTPLGNMLVASLSSLTIGSLLGVFFNMPLFDNIVSAGLAILFAFYISYDTQMIVGGRHHKYAYSQKEYILAALNLYQDLINMFLEIVKLLARNKRHTKHDRDR